MTKALALHVTGVVQGVGFRPFVYNLAVEQGLAGWVLNASDGVHCVVEGPDAAVDTFPVLLEQRAPSMSVIERVVAEEIEPEGFTSFEIRESVPEKDAMTLVSPDIATCPDCRAELLDPSDRRCGYPFINCTNCGPRFTIIEDVPYDRPMTTMRDFPMCEACAAEYGDPSDRRFHAQPDACFICGPRLYLNGPFLPQDWQWSPEVEVSPRPHRDEDVERLRSDAILHRVASELGAGAIVAIKGLGGFHLACDATNPDAVAKLRQRKHRWGKPLAIMARELESLRAYVQLNDKEADLLTGPVRPIVLAKKCVGPFTPAPGAPLPLAAGVADELAEIGVMLPYTPLHHILLGLVAGPLVMTSGNLSDEPIATGNIEALDRLATLADFFLLHDRDIYSRYDDSVVRVVSDIVEPVRRARGYAPHPLPLSFTTDVDILAVGPEQKNTFTLLKGAHAFVSQHIGDLENAETLASFEQTIALYERLFRVNPRIIAHDLHPEYLSTKWALATDLPKVGVQHHHAHIVSVTAEHGVADKVLGFAFDGTGYGEDGRIWGGEVLLADWSRYERYAHLRYLPMPGGAGAIRRPARMALGALQELGLLGHPGALPMLSRLAEGEQQTILRMIERKVNTPMTSSMGRLFDVVAALAGVADDARYEGEAAILLEAAAHPSAEGAYAFGLPSAEDAMPLTIDPTPVLLRILDDIAAQIPIGVISTRFHRAVVGCIVSLARDAARSTGTSFVALAGGVFMNRLVLGGAVSGLEAAGLVPLTHVRVPANDGAVSFGQAVVAWSRRHEV